MKKNINGWGMGMKRIASVFLVCLFALSLAGCGRFGIIGHEADWLFEDDDSGYDDSYSEPELSVTPDAGDSDASEPYFGEVGETISTCFFDYSIDSVETVTQWDGVEASSGMVFLDTVVTIENTFGSDLPMSIYDFQLQWGDFSSDEFDYEAEAFWQDPNAMPEQYTLADGDTVTMHMVYQMPKTALDDYCVIVFEETFDDESTGDLFVVAFTPQQMHTSV